MSSLLKLASDVAILGLVSNNNGEAYLNNMRYFINYCILNELSIKEMLVNK